MMNMVNDEFISLNSKSFSELLADDENAEKSRDRDERSQAQDQGPSANMDANNSACNGTNGANNSTARFRSMTPSSIPIPKSSGLFTVPPGFSPSSFLDSPVLLPSSQAMISPTTGTFPLLPLSFENTSNNDEFKNMEMGDSSGFAFKPHAGSGFGLDFHSMGNLGTYGYEHHQYFKGHENETSMFPTTGALTEQHVSVPSLQAVSSEGIAAPEDSFDDQQQEQSSESNLNSDPVTTVPCGALEKPSDDGYNWRKYGQKHVKGSECPRSYYKCTHPGCPTKKKVERSPDGQVTEIIYKGVHNHAKPQATRRVGCFSNPANEDGDLVEGCTSVKVEGTPEHSSISESEEFDGRAVSNNAGDDEDEPDSKRIKCETNARDIIGATRTIREPRVVVQTTSDIDILDDGYRWRKYGQKVVKGNPNPRSYYKCTNSGCQVRKHVERAAHDPKAVITTYEGKHNHDVPAPRSSSHGSAPTGLGTASSLTSLPNNNALPVPSGAVNLSASDIQGTVSQFDNQHELGNQYERNMGVQLGYGVFGLQNKNEEMHKATTMPVSHATQMKHSDHAISSAGLNSSSMHQYFFQQNESRNGLIQPKEELTDNFQFNTSLH